MDEVKRYVVVGVFSVVGLAIGIAIVLLIGSGHSLLGSRATLHTAFRNVSGLKPGAPVRIGGLDVGTVTTVEFGDDRRVHVTFEIELDALSRLRSDSSVKLGNKGLLGDRLLDLDTGSARGRPIRDGATLNSIEPRDLFAEASDIGSEARVVLRNATKITEALADPQFTEDVQGIAHNLTVITRELATGDGTAGRLLRDESMGRDIAESVAGLSDLTRQMSGVASDVRAITREVRHGDGTAHELIYGDEGARLVGELSSAASELRQSLQQIREGDGGLHDLIYGEEGERIVENLAEATDSLQTILDGVEQGRGTIGGLLVDPSIYEDIKRLVGDLERNEVLRALVRYSITEDERRPTARRPAATPRQAPAPPPSGDDD